MPLLTPEALDHCPVDDGFRQRGIDMTRTETFVDAAFAFAVTLLVVSIDTIPSNYGQLKAALWDAPAFVLSFILLLVVWYAHWGWSRRYGLEDRPTIILSAALVLVVLCYVYPLKMLAKGFMAAVIYRDPTDMIRSGDELYGLFVIYSVGFLLICAIIILLNLHAWRRREDLRLNALERFDTKAEIGAWTALGVIAFLAMLVALLTPPSRFGWPGWVYSLSAIVMPMYGVKVGRRRKSLLPPAAAGSSR